MVNVAPLCTSTLLATALFTLNVGELVVLEGMITSSELLGIPAGFQFSGTFQLALFVPVQVFICDKAWFPKNKIREKSIIFFIIKSLLGNGFKAVQYDLCSAAGRAKLFTIFKRQTKGVLLNHKMPYIVFVNDVASVDPH
jgi:hypothetical protein